MLSLEQTPRFQVFGLAQQSPQTDKKRRNDPIISKSLGSSSPFLIDIDANLLHDALRNDIDDLRHRAFQDGIYSMIIPGSNLKDSEESIQLSSSTTNHNKNNISKVYSTIGIHPYNTPPPNVNDNLSLYMNKVELLILNNLKYCKAIGESGLDSSNGFPPLSQQIPYFIEHVKLSLKYNLPLFLHERGAFKEFIEILDQYGFMKKGKEHKTANDTNNTCIEVPKVVIHCFTGSRKHLEEYVQNDYYIGITGYIFRKNDEMVNELITALRAGVVPLNRLMIETDAPYGTWALKGVGRGLAGRPENILMFPMRYL
mmetsp:Transcript_54371/g.69889  ORF Transcript_54371/g.69889 Transcript_54371/m.69889 type:complete len:313 (-) Transcript_54371:196-1134(-)